MALPDEIRYNYNTPLVWANSSDYSDTVSGLVRTAQLDLTSLGTSGSRQGDKVDLGLTGLTVPRQYLVSCAFEMASAPDSLRHIEVWWAGSPSGTAGNANPGGTSGVDSSYGGTPGDTVEDSVRQLQYLGSFSVTSDAIIQFSTIGILDAQLRFGMPVVFNRSNQAFVANAVSMFVALHPLMDQIVD